MKNEKYENDEKLAEGEIVINNKFLSAISNFWFYHKWKVIIALFAILLITVASLQTCSNQRDDITILYAGSCYLPLSDMDGILAAFNDVMPRDFNNDGIKSADVAMVNIYSAEQVEERHQQALQDDRVIEINTYVNSRELTSYDNLILAGEYSVCIVEPWLYQRVTASGGYRKLSDVLGYQPENAIDDYCIRFKDTDFAKKYADVFADLTEDTVICFRTYNSIGSLTGGNKGEKTYKEAEEMFRAILNYKG